MGDKSKYLAVRRKRKRKFTGNRHAKSDNSAKKKDGLNQNFLRHQIDPSSLLLRKRLEIKNLVRLENYVNEGFFALNISLLCAFISSSM